MSSGAGTENIAAYRRSMPKVRLYTFSYLLSMSLVCVCVCVCVLSVRVRGVIGLARLSV
jgi:hypothetical protein